MVQWTAEERAAISSSWAKVDQDNDGHSMLQRVFLTYPWTQRYFGGFGDLSSPVAIAGNAKVHAHGKKVLSAINKAVHNPDDMKETLAALSQLPAQELYGNPEDFKHLCESLVILLAARLGAEFTPQVQSAWEKFVNVLVAALTHG
ncbi:hemoglobin subunit beta-3-like [Hyperolius riggenbachi]|uniref:hemoglobin subunit beta-3-like n=1 Tax=Hyperolius riggenbachi TaxID=752182 RepID=UPI0035A2EDC5